MLFTTVYLLALFSTCTLAKQCTNVTIPINIEARQAIFNQVQITDNFVAAKLALNFTSQRNGGNYTDQVVAGYQNVVGDYTISATFCRPDRGIPDDPTIQLLIHGIGFDKSYWDLPFDDYAYSYTNLAVDQYNFCTLAIDRFGIGESSHAEPINIVQAPASMSSIYEITQMLRNGTLPQVPTQFSKIVHVGHSFGSFLSYFLVTTYPNISDGLILTGFSLSGNLKQTIAGWNLHLASLNQPLRFGNVVLYQSHGLLGPFRNPLAALLRSGAATNVAAYFSTLLSKTFPGSGIPSSTVYQDTATTEVADIINGYNYSSVAPQDLPPSYLTWSDLTGNIFAFLYPPFFDPQIALYAESTKQPVTVGELFTIGNAPATAVGFNAPVLIITGRQDNIYCGGDCFDAAVGTGFASVPAAAAMAFPDVDVFESYVQPDTGHGMNFHYNATGYYSVVQEFLVANGLGSE